jgi:membrane-bound lytic murein transglycosylase B
MMAGTMRRRSAARALAVTLVWPVLARADAAVSYDERPDVRLFATEVATRRGWDADWVLAQLAEARLRPASQRLMMPGPGGRRPDWGAYHDRFVEPRRIGAGADFWRRHADTLARAEARFGVPPEIVVGIIGVETFYGRVMGSHRVLDALATLAFDFPTGRSDRSPYFREELEEFLLLARREGIAPASVRGSYAGAIGLPQFMPGSINRFAIDFDGDGHVDLHGSSVDAIGSVARFLAEHGWQRGLPTHYSVVPPADGAARARLLGPDIVPSFTAAQMLDAGAVLSDAGRAHVGPLALVMVENGDRPPSHYAGTTNFFSLTRYNRSSYYALAVIHLGQAVRAEL